MEKCWICFFFSLTFIIITARAQPAGFVSLDCGGKDNFTDDLGLEWTSDNQFPYGEVANILLANETRKQYMTLRYFPADNKKYCYTLDVKTRTRYLVRASFLYGNFDNSNVYPKFDIAFGATYWSTIVISDASTMEVRELMFLATTPTISVCLSNATTGQPFVSTLELRQFNGSIYYTDHETQFFLSVSARINFGANSEDPVRYPDDPFDRIWVSDSLKKANYLVDVAPGTKKVSTTMPIDVNRDERPPVKVMQTAVVGTNGSLTYRLNLNGFPGFGWAVCYFAEIEDLSPTDSRIFRLVLPNMPEVSKAAVNILENAHGKYQLYEPGYTNISLPFVFSFKFLKATESTRGPLLNAMEINSYLEINLGSLDTTAIIGLVSKYPLANWAHEGGDPCLPVSWSWLRCNSDPQPRITSIFLSGKNLTGNIPSDITNLPGLIELWLDGNSFTGPIPDFTGCTELKIIHLENNHLNGELPSSLMNLENLRELYLQNNMLSGVISSDFLRRNLVLNFTGNINLRIGKRRERNTLGIIIGCSISAVFLLVATIFCCLFMNRVQRRYAEEDEPAAVLPVQRNASLIKGDGAGETAYCFSFSEIEEATKTFEKKVGSGGFGVVYYGKLKDGKEIAVKVLTSDSYQGKREFSNEVTLLSRIHHRNLVQFLGYCQDEVKNIESNSILVYEFMHNGTLKEQVCAPLKHEGTISWIKRLEIAEDAAKGIEYLHTGCVPSVVHRDLKSSNILLDKHMRAKVSDFGLSKVEGTNAVSGIVRGTVGYLDPEYYISQQFTEKSDIYSFGVILLELISGKEALSNEGFGIGVRSIVQWAKTHIQSGDIHAIIDPSLNDRYTIQSVWKIAEKAMMCLQPHGVMRPSISEVLKEIQEAILIEKAALAAQEGHSVESIGSIRSSVNIGGGSMDLGTIDPPVLIDGSIEQPTPR
ncbi:hypothetical protein Scep_004736 [Stephania cephalantha]|uniref:non-specific serine/threonine protein kinase n=1 Tax=Stephania cephalantha TaxID=152367 RepID=A0AAP0KUQ6_9MAGN